MEFHVSSAGAIYVNDVRLTPQRSSGSLVSLGASAASMQLSPTEAVEERHLPEVAIVKLRSLWSLMVASSRLRTSTL